MVKNNVYIGWDIGGAHVKAALISQTGQLQKVVQLPCALWRGLNLLETTIDEILKQFNTKTIKENIVHAVTMTGELVDLFENRQTGVLEISRVMQEKLSGEVNFFKVLAPSNYEFISFDQISTDWQQVASMNWFASAIVIAQHTHTALLIDMGSTTTDFMVMYQGKPNCSSFTDAARMQTQALVYTGVVRTPLMALAQRVEFKGKLTALAAEYFATTADVYRLLNQLPADEDMAETADGQDKSQTATARRIARMIGHDVEDFSIQDWVNLAENIKKLQFNQLLNVAKIHLVHLLHLDQSLRTIKIIGAGAGQFLLKEIAVALDIEMQKNQHSNPNNGSITIKFQACEEAVIFEKSATVSTTWASICFPAVAVATLAYQNQLE